MCNHFWQIPISCEKNWVPFTGRARCGDVYWNTLPTKRQSPLFDKITILFLLKEKKTLFHKICAFKNFVLVMNTSCLTILTGKQK